MINLFFGLDPKSYQFQYSSPFEFRHQELAVRARSYLLKRTTNDINYYATHAYQLIEDTRNEYRSAQEPSLIDPEKLSWNTLLLIAWQKNDLSSLVEHIRDPNFTELVASFVLHQIFDVMDKLETSTAKQPKGLISEFDGFSAAPTQFTHKLLDAAILLTYCITPKEIELEKLVTMAIAEKLKQLGVKERIAESIRKKGRDAAALTNKQKAEHRKKICHTYAVECFLHDHMHWTQNQMANHIHNNNIGNLSVSLDTTKKYIKGSKQQACILKESK